MEAKHTPGPWWPVDGRRTGFKTASGGESILADARPTDDFFILKIAEMDTNVSPTERAANARLIAAAPDLLEALKELRVVGNDQAARRAARAKAEVAIRKATGAGQ